jgi:hypothetical protein
MQSLHQRIGGCLRLFGAAPLGGAAPNNLSACALPAPAVLGFEEIVCHDEPVRQI